MMTTLSLSQTLAVAPNSLLNTPIVPGPHTSWVMRMSTLTQTLSPGWTDFLPEARAMIFSVSVTPRDNTQSVSTAQHLALKCRHGSLGYFGITPWRRRDEHGGR